MREIFRVTYEDELPRVGDCTEWISHESDCPSWWECIFDDGVMQWWGDVVASVRAGWRQICLV